MEDDEDITSGRWSGHKFTSGEGRGGEPLNWQHEYAKQMWEHWAEQVSNIMELGAKIGSYEDAIETTRAFLKGDVTDEVLHRVARMAWQKFQNRKPPMLEQGSLNLVELPISDELKQRISKTLSELLEYNLKGGKEL